ncbi:hypothetical protein J2X31_000644 [Flavobacterium arsenatis]|uniref:Secretion system C-terminal sorting domain-containing protein n=1 Tax=Flavobacterium arsenatis TaxID=1484332 RepID=A0ABU1TKZ2_9FLAO|nr:T9SS type A sorting domain-containing protein [Flavobacterium arsenatis]MDR6966646.1 hypothetical protein [Flavobacterium arsenatis]
MKKLYTLLLSILVTAGYAQTTVFSEDLATPPAGNPTATDYTGYQNGSPIVFTGNATIRTTSPSENYTGASGSGCVFIGGATPSQSFMIEGINTTNYSDLTLSFGHYKTTNAGSNELTVQVSGDGENWTPMAYSRPTGTGTSNWILVTPTGTIPSTENLRIKFENPVTTVGFRIDDIKIVGTTLGIGKNSIEGLKVYPNPVVDGKLYINTDANSSKEVVIYDVLGKQVLKATTSNAVNVSNLNGGVYIVKITEEGKTATRKLVIK